MHWVRKGEGKDARILLKSGVTELAEIKWSRDGLAWKGAKKRFYLEAMPFLMPRINPQYFDSPYEAAEFVENKWREWLSKSRLTTAHTKKEAIENATALVGLKESLIKRFLP